MGWSSRGLRGSLLEEMINLTNDYYRSTGLALIQKIPTPITPVQFDKEKRNITLAYFEKQSTVDYIGVVQGIPICFDAKDTTKNSLPISNIHEHQINFMKDFEKQKGISFLLVHFLTSDEYFFLPFKVIQHFYDQALIGGKKSIPYTEFKKNGFVIQLKGAYIHYLEAINEYLNLCME